MHITGKISMMLELHKILCECYKDFGSSKQETSAHIIIWQIGPAHLELVDQEPDQQFKLQKVQLK